MQSVIINGVRSTTVDLTTGVPQGLVLGPVLFLVYIIPLRSVIRCHPGVAIMAVPMTASCTPSSALDNYRRVLQQLEMYVEEVRV